MERGEIETKASMLGSVKSFMKEYENKYERSTKYVRR
jgi:hypothetical protein